MNRRISMALALSFCFLFLGSEESRCQGFRGIVPLESTCADVKRILKVDKCKGSKSIYFLPEFWVDVEFEEGKGSQHKLCYKVPPGTVTSVMVMYNKPIPLKDFGYKLKYAEGPFGDIQTTAYENRELGLAVLTNDGFVRTAIFSPTAKQHKRFAYACGKQKKT